MKILLINNSLETQEIIHYILKEYTKIDIHHAKDGLEGIEAAQQDKFDLILTHYQIPRIKSEHFLKAVRRGGEINQQTPIIFIGSSTDDLQIERVSFISKPFSFKQISSCLKSAKIAA